MTRDGGVEGFDVVVARGDLPTMHEDEDLPEPRRHEWPWLGRMLRPLAVFAVVCVTALGVARFVSLAGSTKTSAVVAAVSVPAGPEPRSGDLDGISIPITGTAAEIITNRDLRRLCKPQPNSCSTTALLPGDVVAALRAVFPAMRVQSATTVAYVSHYDGHRSLWYRSVRAEAPGREIELNILPITPRDHVDTGSIVDGGGVQVYAYRLVAGYVVQLLVRFDGALLHPLTALRGLPDDHRLLALG